MPVCHSCPVTEYSKMFLDQSGTQRRKNKKALTQIQTAVLAALPVEPYDPEDSMVLCQWQGEVLIGFFGRLLQMNHSTNAWDLKAKPCHVMCVRTLLLKKNPWLTTALNRDWKLTHEAPNYPRTWAGNLVVFDIMNWVFLIHWTISLGMGRCTAALCFQTVVVYKKEDFSRPWNPSKIHEVVP